MKSLKFDPPAGFAAEFSGMPETVTFFLHGFPGIRSKQNREIAEIVAQETRQPVHLLLYSGLGHAPGEFNFERCVSDVLQHFENFLAESPELKINLVGHSWGGFLSLLVANRFAKRINRVVLMSPLLKFFDEPTMEKAVEDYLKQYPDIRMQDPLENGRGFVRIGREHSTEELAKGFPSSVPLLFLQAKEDDVTPTSVAQEFRSKFPRAPEFRLAENDHSFLSRRPELAREISNFLKM